MLVKGVPVYIDPNFSDIFLFISVFVQNICEILIVSPSQNCFLCNGWHQIEDMDITVAVGVFSFNFNKYI